VPSSDTGFSGQIATGGTTSDAAPQEPLPLKKAERAPILRRTSLALAAVAGLSAITVGFFSAMRTDAPARPASAPPAVISRVPCAPAVVSGVPVTDAAELFGRAACARLAVALGVPWDASPSAAPLAVTVTTANTTRVTISLAGQSAEAEAPKPIPAIDAAARALAEKLGAPPLGSERQHALGAPTEAAGRQLEAILRRHAARFDEDPTAQLSSAMALAPDSPWPRLLAMPGAAAPQVQRLRADAILGAATLPEPFSEAARGAAWWYAPRTDTERVEALSALRRTYAVRPEDPQIASLLGQALLSTGLYEEAAAVGLRAAERAPHESLAPVGALVRGGPPDPTWISLRGRLLDTLEKLLPEARGWDARTLHEAQQGHVAQAREALALGDAIGLPSATGRSWGRDLARAAVEIADDQPERARALAQPFLGSPLAAEAAEATRLLVEAHLLEGHVAEAETALARDIARLEALDDRPRLAERWIRVLTVRRRLGLPPPDFVSLAKVEATVPVLETAQSPLAPVLRVELFLAQHDRKDRSWSAAAADVRSAVEAYARKVARGDRARQDDLAIAAVPLVLAASKLPGVRSFWRSLDRARFSAQLPYLLTYGLACEKANELEEAEKAFRAVASAPLAVDGLSNVAARLRLVQLLDKAGKKDEAAKWRDSTARLLRSADDGLRDALTRNP
jgi:hypothetical protein